MHGVQHRSPSDPKLPVLRGPKPESRFVSESAWRFLKLIRDLRPAFKRMESLAAFAQRLIQPSPSKTPLRSHQHRRLEIWPAIPGEGHTIRTGQRISYDCHFAHSFRRAEEGRRPRQ